MANYNRTCPATGSYETSTGTSSVVVTQNVVTGDTITATVTVTTPQYNYHVSTTVSTITNATYTTQTTSGVRNTTSSGDPGTAGNQSGNSPSAVFVITPTNTGSYTVYFKHRQFFAFFEGEAGYAWYRYYSNNYGRLTGTMSSNAQFASGPIAFSAIQSVFGGSNPISLSEYNEGGSYVPDNDDNNSIADSSSNMSLSHYRNSTTTIPIYNSGTISMASSTQNLPGKGGGQATGYGFFVGSRSFRAPVWNSLGSISAGLVKIEGNNYGDLNGFHVLNMYGNYYTYVVISGPNGSSTPPSATGWSTAKLYDSGGNLDLTLNRSSSYAGSTGTFQNFGTMSRYWLFYSNSTTASIMTGANGGYITIE